MNQASALSQLITLTAGLVPTAQTTAADLQTAREALANNLLRYDMDPGTSMPGLPVTASRSPSPAELVQLSVPATFAPTQPARMLAAGSAGTIAFEYASPSGTPAEIAVAITPATWLVEINGANVRLDMTPFDGLMRTAGDFQASSGSGVAFHNTKLVLGSVLQPLEDLLQFLAQLGLPDPLSTSFSNGGWSQTRKYKLKAGLQLKLPDQIPALIPLFNTSLGTLQITLKTGFGNTVSSSGTLLSSSSQWLFYFNFSGTVQVAVLPPLPVQAGGIVGFALEVDFPAGSTPQEREADLPARRGRHGRQQKLHPGRPGPAGPGLVRLQADRRHNLRRPDIGHRRRGPDPVRQRPDPRRTHRDHLHRRSRRPHHRHDTADDPGHLGHSSRRLPVLVRGRQLRRVNPVHPRASLEVTMATNPAFSLSLLAFPQSWDGTNLNLRILVMPQGDPLNPLFTNVPPAPDSPAFADAKPAFVAELIPSLAALPAPASATSQVSLTTTPPAQARPLFQRLAAQFDIAADPPGRTPRRTGYSIRKYLPESYTSAFNFDSPSTPFAVTDDTYYCMLENLPVTAQPPPPSTVSWGRIIGFALRQPLLATALGLLYETSFRLPSPGFFANGGWLYLGLAPSSAFAPQLAVDPALMQPYAARIPALTTARPLFAAVLFPVLSTPPAASYDDAFVEAEEYDDGFVKIVHGSQPETAGLLDTSLGALPPSADIGLRLGWDDEQVTTWFNRQVDAAQIDAPFGTAGYRIDTRAHGSTAWHSMCAVTGAMALGTTALGTFNGELSVETVPAGLDPTQPAQWWLPSYFAQWLGRSVVTADPTALTLHGDPAPSAGQPYPPVGDTAVPLRYGQSYDFRIRMTDLSRGGPAVSDSAVNPGAVPIGTIPFRRFVPFQPVTVTNLNQTATPAAPQTMYEIGRPLLNYPAAVFAGIPDAAATFVPSDNDYAPYSLLYQTTRTFPANAAQSLQLTVTFQDVPDIGTFPAQPATGALVLPRARDIRLVFRAAGKADPQLLYWGSAAAATGPAVEVLTGANGADERGIFVPGIAATRMQGVMLQPDPAQTSNFIAVQALLGKAGSTTSDLASRLANALSLTVSGLTHTGQPGERIAFGCSAALRNSLSPEHAAITFAAKAELTQHWLIVTGPEFF
jgi:hypothetical protein